MIVKRLKNGVIMNEKKGFLNRFSIYEIIVIALMATLGLATKPVIVPLTHMLTSALFIPGGAVAGGFYMMWIVLGASLVRKRGGATLIAFTQALIVVVLGAFGSHGIMSIATYTIPGLMVDLVFFALRRRINTPTDFFLAGVVANLSGTYLSNLVFFRLPLIPLLLSLVCGALSGGFGGIIAYMISKKIKALNILDV